MKLEETNSEEDIKKCQENNYPVWGKPLTIEEYQERDWVTYKTEYMGDNHHYFVIKNENGDIESSCEILIRDCWIKKKDSTEIINARCGVIGSVFTAEKYRGKGNASLMMKELNNLIDNKYLTGENDVAFLYSEIGNYYERFGYKTFHVPVYKLDPTKYYQENANIYQYHEITSDFDEITNDLKTRVLNELKNSDHSFALKPQPEIFDWFNRRSRVTFKATHQKETPIVNGFSFSDENGKFNYITFTITYQSNDCSILSASVHGESQKCQLLSLVSKYCIEYKIMNISVWHSTLDMSAIETHEKNDSVSGIRAKQDLDWISNEKWCWF